MAIQIAIIGLGQIGTSVGLALAEKKDMLYRIGHDQELGIARRADKMGAVDRVETNLLKAVSGADLVLLALPLDQIRETMEYAASDLKAGAVVMDTGPVKETVAAWANELLPENCHYIGLTPVINPVYLHDASAGVDAARADLFQGGLMGIVAPPNAHSEAIKLAADLTRVLGATALFVDPLEIDGLMAATHTLPQLLAAGLLNATVDQPGWREGRKIAGRAYAEATGPAAYLEEASALRASVLLNRENVLRVLDGSIAALQAIRNDIDQQDIDALDERLGRAQASREKWWQERQTSDWVGEGMPAVGVPDQGGFLGRLFGMGQKPRSKD